METRYATLMVVLMSTAMVTASRTTFAGGAGGRAALEFAWTRDARLALEEQRYEDALALTSQHTNDPDELQRAAAFEITALGSFLLGKEVEANDALTKLYDLAPGFVLEDRSMPPSVRSAFAREAARPHGRGVGMQVAWTDADKIDLKLTAPAARVEGSCRASEKEPLAAVTLRSIEAKHFVLAPPATGRVSCAFVALSGAGLPLGRLGTASAPITISPPAPKGLASRWWFWTGLGVLVAGGGVTTYFLTRPHEVSPPAAPFTLDLGTRSR